MKAVSCPVVAELKIASAGNSDDAIVWLTHYLMGRQCIFHYGNNVVIIFMK